MSDCGCGGRNRAAEFNAKAAYQRLSQKYDQLAALMTRYMSEAGLERPERATRAMTMARELERIVGGVRTSEFPECCLIGRKNPNGTLGWFCTGVLVHPKIVLTAGHCFISNMKANIVALKADDENRLQQAELISIRRMTQHPRYRQTHQISDMSVIILRTASTVAPVAIASTPEMSAATETTLVGFGNDDVNSTRGFGLKRQVTVPITQIRRSPADNLDSAEQTLGFESDLEFVAGGNGFDSCNGDSGGPAYVTIGGVRKVAGLTSRATDTAGHPCGDGGIYTRVDKHVDFIRQMAQDAGITGF
ncbi:MAG: trypsin-like serine protease [Bryobacteraceae bacterium]